jgi:O-antigen ligase
MQLSEPYAGAWGRLAASLSLPVALRWAAACCWWLTLATLTVDASWRLQVAGRGSAVEVYWFDLPLICLLGCWALALALDPSTPLRLGPRVPLLALVGLTSLALLSAAVAREPHFALAMGARLLLILLFYLYTLNVAADQKPPGTGLVRQVAPGTRAFATAVAAGLAVQGAVALGQEIHQASLGLGFLGERTVNLLTPGVAVVDLHGSHWLRPYGLSAHPNVLGGFVAASLLPIGLWLPRRAAMIALPAAAALLFLTLSRGAMLAAALSVVLYLAAGRRLDLRMARAALGTGLVVVALAAISPAGSLFTARFDAADPLEQFSVRERLSTQSTALGLIAAHPLLGVGADNYLAVAGAPVGGAPSSQGYVPVVHDAYLLAGAEVGLGGAALLALALLWPAVQLFRRKSNMQAGGAAAALVACAAVGLVEFYPWSSPAYGLLWGTLLALWAAGVGPARTAAAGAAA